MKSSLAGVSICAACLLLGSGSGPGSKKPEKPVRERFEATITPPISDDNSMQVEIQEFTTDEEVQNLAHAFASGGQGALDKLLERTQKGHFKMGSAPSMAIRAVQSNAAGASRKLNIIGDAPSMFNTPDGWVSYGHRGYPYTWIELVLDEQGDGNGRLIPFANVRFSKEGRIEIIAMKVGNLQLVKVHSQK